MLIADAIGGIFTHFWGEYYTYTSFGIHVQNIINLHTYVQLSVHT